MPMIAKLTVKERMMKSMETKMEMEKITKKTAKKVGPEFNHKIVVNKIRNTEMYINNEISYVSEFQTQVIIIDMYVKMQFQMKKMMIS